MKHDILFFLNSNFHSSLKSPMPLTLFLNFELVKIFNSLIILINFKELLHVGVSNVLGWVKRLRVKRVTGEKHVNPYTTRLING